jgi:hypothetical protein
MRPNLILITTLPAGLYLFIDGKRRRKKDGEALASMDFFWVMRRRRVMGVQCTSTILKHANFSNTHIFALLRALAASG